MRIDGSLSPDIPCLGRECKGRVSFDNPTNRFQLCDNCWEKKQQEKRAEEELEIKKEEERIEMEKYFKENPKLTTCGVCGLVFKWGTPCPFLDIKTCIANK